MNRILLLGASGTGTTTTAKLLSEKLGWFHGDSDTYFWEPTDPPFEKVRPIEKIEELLKKDLQANSSFILSGSFCGWGDMIIPKLDYVFFLEAPTEVRIHRIKQRESQRFGSRIEPGGIQHKTFESFLKWSAGYEIGGVSRTRKLHEDWLIQNSLVYKKISTDQSQVNIMKEILETLKLGQV